MFFLTECLCIFSTISPASRKSGSGPQVPRSQRHVLVPLRAEAGTQAWGKIMCSNLLTDYSEEMKHQLPLPDEGEKARLRRLLCCSLLGLLFSEKPVPEQVGTAPPICSLYCKISCWAVSWGVLGHPSRSSLVPGTVHPLSLRVMRFPPFFPPLYPERHLAGQAVIFWSLKAHPRCIPPPTMPHFLILPEQSTNWEPNI